jgi:hypothetical protein
MRIDWEGDRLQGKTVINEIGLPTSSNHAAFKRKMLANLFAPN